MIASTSAVPRVPYVEGRARGPGARMRALCEESRLPFGLCLLHRDVEVVHVLTRAERLVEADGRVVAGVGLDEDHVRTTLARDGLERVDEPRGEAAAAVRFGDGKIVDVDLAALALELFQHVR